MGVFIPISNSGSLRTGSVQVTTVRAVILRGKAIEAVYGDSKADLLRYRLLP